MFHLRPTAAVPFSTLLCHAEPPAYWESQQLPRTNAASALGREHHGPPSMRAALAGDRYMTGQDSQHGYTPREVRKLWAARNGLHQQRGSCTLCWPALIILAPNPKPQTPYSRVLCSIHTHQRCVSYRCPVSSAYRMFEVMSAMLAFMWDINDFALCPVLL